MTANLTPVPHARRVIALEDATNWLRDATRHYAAGDTPAAVYDTHIALEHCQAALDELINDLPYPGRCSETSACQKAD